MTTISIDIETFSDNDIKFGVYKYTDTPNFDILIFAYSLNGEEVVEIDLTQEELPQMIVDLILDDTVIKTAYNAQFERVCLSRYFNRLGLLDGFLDPKSWRCTMVKAQELGLPASLKQCASYLELEEQKDTAGTALINYFSKPCKPTKANGMRTRNLPQHAPDKWEAFKAYCGQDVRTEMAIAQELSGYQIHDREWDHYQLDQRMHDRGTGVDLELAQGAMAIDQAIRAEALQKMGVITGLENPNSVSQIKDWLSDRGYEFNSLSKALIEEVIQKPDIDPTVKQVLELRLARSNTSTKKYVMMDDATCSDGRIRGLLQFYGATRTGRYCLAEGTPVLVKTDRGSIYEKPIEKVSEDDLVWDGIEWVAHEGVVYSGDKEVITWDGITATPSHYVFLSDAEKVTLLEAKMKGAKIWTGNTKFIE